MSAWKPLADAPKDGRRIIARWNTYADELAHEIVRWESERSSGGDWISASDGYYVEVDDSFEYMEIPE